MLCDGRKQQYMLLWYTWLSWRRCMRNALHVSFYSFTTPR